MELNQVIYVESLLLCLAILAVLFVANLKFWRPIIINRLSLVYIFLAIAIVFYIGKSFSNGNVQFAWVNKLCTIVGSILMTLSCMFYYYYVLKQVGLLFKNAKIWYISSFLAILGSATVYIVSAWTGTAFYIDEAGFNQKGPVFYGDLIASYAYILCGVIFALVKAHRSELLADKHRFISIAAAAIPTVTLGILDMVLPYPDVLPTTYFGAIISLLFLFTRSTTGRMTRDPLTGLLNRMAFDGSLNRASKKRGPASLWLFVIDINHFKEINDTFGHSIGDVVLIKLASTLENISEQNKCTVGRWGGDEFVMFGEFSSKEEARSLVSDLKSKVLTECNTDERFIVSVSVGAAELREFESLKHLFDEADHMLYEDKAKYHRSNSNGILRVKD